MRRRVLAGSVAGMMMLALIVAAPAPAMAATLVAIPNAGPPGAPVTLQGTGFNGIAGSASLCWDAPGCSNLGNGLVVLGALTGVVDIPASATVGTHTIHACQAGALDPCAWHGSATVTVTEPLVTTTTVTSITTTTLIPTTTSSSITTTSTSSTTTTTVGARPTTTIVAPAPTTTNPRETSTTTIAEATSTTTTVAASPAPTTPNTTIANGSDGEEDELPIVVSTGGPLGPGDFLTGNDATGSVNPPSSPRLSLTGWLSGQIVAGPGALVLGPLVVLGVILRALASAGSGLVAPAVALVIQLLIFAWDRTRASDSATDAVPIGS